MTEPTSAAAVLREYLADAELEHEEIADGVFTVTMPGERKLQVPVRLDVGPHALGVHAFVCRRPDEDHEVVYRFLLQRNARLYGVHYMVDRMGDVHLVGRVPLDAVTADELDRVLGQVLEAADGDFNTLLELGFASSIRREYAWRSERGESTANLKAFEHLFG